MKILKFVTNKPNKNYNNLYESYCPEYEIFYEASTEAELEKKIIDWMEKYFKIDYSRDEDYDLMLYSQNKEIVIQKAKYVKDFKIWVQLTDNSEALLDFDKLLNNKNYIKHGIREIFKQFYIENGVINWELKSGLGEFNDFGIAPEFIIDLVYNQLDKNKLVNR